MLRVIFDISVLGIGHYNVRGRTGVYRVVESLMNNMKNMCELRLCAQRNLKVLAQAKGYIKSHKELSELPFIETGMQGTDYTIEQLWNLEERVGPSFPNNVIKSFLSLALKGLNLFISPVDMKELCKADIYHSPFFPFPDKTRDCGVIRFLTIHDLIPLIYPWFFESRECSLMKKTLQGITHDDFIVCMSQSTKNDLCENIKIDPSRVFVTYPGVSETFTTCTEEQHLHVRRKYTIPEGRYFLSIATLEPRKNIAHTIDCFASVVKEYHLKDLYLVLVGTPGWKYGNIFKKISHDPQLKKHIIFTGFADDEDLPALYSGAWAFIYPSLYEGFGLPPLEAMKCGCPVITSHTSSLPEVVGHAALMVDPTDADALCQCVVDLYTNESLRRDMSERSLKQAQKFTWHKCACQTYEAYSKAIG
jgi:glycosyltransferase involved in cell wall biosynthesis